MAQVAAPRGSILITGAGSGLGAALALEYASPGQSLVLWGRDRDRLLKVADACRTKGATCSIVSVDIRHHAEVREQVAVITSGQPLRLAILNAGVSSGTAPDGQPEGADEALATMAINGTASIYMAALLLEHMRKGEGGRLAAVCSLAALYPLPDSPAYCAAKTALAVYMSAMASHPANRQVGFSTVYPGYVDTAMSRRLQGAQPFRIPAAEAAKRIRQGLDAGKGQIVFPRILAAGILCLKLLPSALARVFLKAFAFRVDREGPKTNAWKN